MNASDLVENWLKTKGISSERDGGNNLVFNYQDLTLVCPSDDADKQFLRIIIPNNYTVEDKRKRKKVLEACNEITADNKVVKAFLVEDSLWFTIEMFVDTTPKIEDFMERCLEILMQGRMEVMFKLLS